MRWNEVSFYINNSFLIDEVSEYLANLLKKGCFIDDKSIRFYFDDHEFIRINLEGIKNELENLFGEGIFIVTKDLKNEDWLNKWKEGFKPLKIGNRFIIAPPWETIDSLKEVVIKINPGMAFGTGHHATTRMMIEMMEHLYDNGLFSGKDVLDLGTGSGILAIASHFLDAKSIYALDIDPEVSENLKENLQLNSLSERVKIYIGELGELDMDFDIILANIDLNNLIKLKKDITDRLKSKGYLLVSGILAYQREEFLSAFLNELELFYEKIDADGEWIALAFKRY